MNEPQQSEKRILDAARRMPTEERTIFLEKTFGADSQMRERVESLLAAQTPSTTSTPSTPSTPATSGPSGTVVTDNDATIGATEALPAEEALGDVIGRYKLVEKIGEGGFGLVYVAEQTEPVKRQVALKIIKLGMDTRQVVARFEAERQTLALMEHPNIAKVLDAGATDTGRPFFVMELVRGTKITEYCDRNKLSTRKRLDLFILVCRAIEHAHQKGIIHRDIKPSNILVTMHDDVAVPKVIDFGIAKATQGNLTDQAVHTQIDQFIGTPAYMSPEQAEAGGLDIDTRSDIYSLGVLLYELLTGETPLESKNLLARGYEEMRRLIREWEPQLPSIRLHKQKIDEQTTTIATRHGTDTPKLIRLVRGDLDWVVMKCLEKDRSRRYDSAAQLTTDIQRFLDHEPVMARPPSKLYRFQKLVRRNRLAFAAGSAILVSLIAGLCVTSWFVIKEKKERDIAEKAGQDSERDLKIAVTERAKSEQARTLAEEAQNKSEVDRKHAEEALRQSELDRAKAMAAEKKAEDSQKEAETARQQAETARQQAELALQQARDDRNKTILAEKEAKDSQTQAQTARQQAKVAETRAISEAGKSEEATKAAAYEASLRQQAEAARDQAQAFLQQARIARQQAEAAATAALADAAALTDAAISGKAPEATVAEASQSRETIANFLSSLDTLPPAEALKVAVAFYKPGNEKRPWAARFLRQRGEWRGRQGDWTNAVADFSKALDLEPSNLTSYDVLAPLLAQNGESNAFSSHCARLLAKFGGTNDPATARVVARDCLLAPLPGADLGAVSALAQYAVEVRTNAVQLSDSQLTLGLAEYRQGHYAQAADWLGKALAGSGQNAANDAQVCAALAMAEQQLKQTDNARATLARGMQIIDTKLPKLESGDLGPDWSQWIMARVLMREAAALINGPSAAR